MNIYCYIIVHIHQPDYHAERPVSGRVRDRRKRSPASGNGVYGVMRMTILDPCMHTPIQRPLMSDLPNDRSD